MYPSQNEPHRYSTDGHPAGPAPVSGILNPNSQAYVPPAPYISTSLPRVHVGAEKRSTGLCHCCDDLANCFVTCFCPCITSGQIAEIVSKACASAGAAYGLLAMTGFACSYSCFYCSKWRAQHDFEESPRVDCLVHFFCEACALCQKYRELHSRGFDTGTEMEAGRPTWTDKHVALQ